MPAGGRAASQAWWRRPDARARAAPRERLLGEPMPVRPPGRPEVRFRSAMHGHMAAHARRADLDEPAHKSLHLDRPAAEPVKEENADAASLQDDRAVIMEHGRSR